MKKPRKPEQKQGTRADARLPRVRFYTRQHTGNPFRRYEQDLGINVNSFRGKTVLDVASGYSNFAKECRARGINCFAMDLPNVLSRINKRFEDNNGKKFAVAGKAQEMPFKSNSVDLIVSRRGLFHVPNLFSIQYCVKEALRVLKPGGELRFDPPLGILTESKVRKEFENWLERNNFQIEKHYEREFPYLVIRKTGNFEKLNQELR